MRTFRPHLERLEDRTLLAVQVLATLGDPAPGPGNPGFLINDFEPGGLNNRGTVIYGADLGTTSDPSSFVGEAIYLRNKQGKTIRLAGSTDPAPGTSTVFDGQGFYGPVTLNDAGDAALSFQLSPFQLPFGDNAGLFRYSHITNAVTPVVLPGVTPAPGTGGVPDQGLYLWSKGKLTLVARSGTELAGIGTIAELSAPRNIIVGPSPGDFPTGGAYLNDRGQVFFSATLTDGRDVLLLSSRTSSDADTSPGQSLLL